MVRENDRQKFVRVVIVRPIGEVADELNVLERSIHPRLRQLDEFLPIILSYHSKSPSYISRT
jgi:hypothetical protein